MKKHKSGTKVLADHKQVGKVFIPPMLTLGEFKDVSWYEDVVPELLWIAIILRAHGHAEGTNLTLGLAKAAAASISAKPKPLLALNGAFASLNPSQLSAINESLGASRAVIANTLGPMLRLYPQCPLAFLAVSTEEPKQNTLAASDIATVKDVLRQLLDKTCVFSTWAQASVVYIAFVNDQLKVFEGLALANFPEVEFYPSTEESIRVAASVRATVNMIVGHGNEKYPNPWKKYFWNRGLELEPCEVLCEEVDNVGR